MNVDPTAEGFKRHDEDGQATNGHIMSCSLCNVHGLHSLIEITAQDERLFLSIAGPSISGDEFCLVALRDLSDLITRIFPTGISAARQSEIQIN